MVYSKITLIFGVKITSQELAQVSFELFNFIGDDLESPYVDQDEVLPNELEFFPSVCHSKKPLIHLLGWQKGNVMWKYETRCGKCKIYGLCNRCLGTTNNGVYNIKKIAENNCVKISNKRICPNCFTDQRKSIWEKCRTCGATTTMFFNRGIYSQQEYVKEDLTNKMKKAIEHFDLPKEVMEKILKTAGYYLYIDDCLTCT